MSKRPIDFALVQSIVEEALTLPLGQRSAYLAQSCAGHTALRREVDKLLNVDEDELDFLERPVFQADTMPGEIGTFRIDAEIGRGGMGAVYRGVHHDDEMSRPVAIKVLKRGMDTDDIVRRFHAEREILGRLEHPNIARLISGGTTKQGRPFFVMEYVDGEPLHHYCDNRQLDIAQRLKLFRKICSAINFAHRNLIVHRDLKPSNILVTKNGDPKLLDFGIAKVIQEDPDATYIRTRTGFQIMTPEYAAPEQIMGGIVTTATDIYSLGVLLYELVTGHRPYQMEMHTHEGMRQAIMDTYPLKPSSAVGRTTTRNNTDGSKRELTPALICAARRTDPKRLRQQLSGDMDTIVLTALRKDPEARYASAEQFSEDLSRFLDGYPIQARRESPGDVFGRMVRTYRKQVTAAALVFLLIIFGMGYLNQRRQAERARLNQANLRDFFLDNISRFDPLSGNFGKRVDARAFLDDTLARAQESLGHDPLNLAGVYNTSGEVYLNLGDTDRAFDAFSNALTLNRRIGTDHLPIFETLRNLAEVQLFLYDLDDALIHVEEALAGYGRTVGADHALYADALVLKARILDQDGLHESALALLDNAYRIFCTSPHTKPQQMITGLIADATARYRSLGLSTRTGTIHCLPCLASLEEAAALHHRQIGVDDGQLALIYTTLSQIFVGFQDYASAEPRIAKAANILAGLVDSGHPELAVISLSLGRIYCQRGDFDTGIPLIKRALALQEETRPENPELIVQYYMLGLYHLPIAQLDQAEQFFLKALELGRSKRSFSEVSISNIVNRLGETRIYLGKYREAEENILEGLAIRRRVMGERNAHVSQSLLYLARLYRDTGEQALSEYLLDETIAMREAFLKDSFDNFSVLAKLFRIEIIARRGRIYEAEAALEPYMQALWENTESCSLMAGAHHTKAIILGLQGLWEEAVVENNMALAQLKQHIDNPLFRLDLYRHQAELLRHLGRLEEARFYEQKALKPRQSDF